MVTSHIVFWTLSTFMACGTKKENIDFAILNKSIHVVDSLRLSTFVEEDFVDFNAKLQLLQKTIISLKETN